MLKPRFQPDDDAGTLPPSRLVDPEAYDATEQEFAASLEETSSAGARFIVEQDPSSLNQVPQESRDGETAAAREQFPQHEKTAEEDSSAQRGKPEAPSPGQWRDEVAARVNHYRSRRRQRAPRYPSLQLKFAPQEPYFPETSTAAVPAESSAGTPVPILESSPPESPRLLETEGAKILEFPRSSMFPPVVRDELAEPVFVQPRILEVPDVLPPPPALGGILIEPGEEPESERRPGFELPLQAAPLTRRLLAGAIDAALVSAAFAFFAYGFYRITAIVPPWRQVATATSALLAAFWIGYEYLLLVYAGTTPGLRLARLQLSRFNGTPVPRRLRRWRVLASALSGLSLALGYAWCFLDEDELCWHDRITRTYMAPKASK